MSSFDRSSLHEFLCLFVFCFCFCLFLFFFLLLFVCFFFDVLGHTWLKLGECVELGPTFFEYFFGEL